MSTPRAENDAWARRASNLMAAHLARAASEHERRVLNLPPASFGDDRPDRIRLRRAQKALRTVGSRSSVQR